MLGLVHRDITIASLVFLSWAQMPRATYQLLFTLKTDGTAEVGY
jgi:hypothetical protein